MDVTSISREMEQWIVDAGAKVVNNGKTKYVKGNWEEEFDVFFGNRKIHHYAGSANRRIFFNIDTVMNATYIFMKWPDVIFGHNIPNNITEMNKTMLYMNGQAPVDS